ncbi:MAG: IS200/IS605 family transposase [Anaerolineales bacterium]|nr:IS200/IS605 family transposase [Anaerolineales bacterium]
MNIASFSADELAFAWCNRIYFAFHTHRRKPIQCLQQLDKESLEELLDPYGIHLLEFNNTEIESRALVSLTVSDSASSAASKIKGRLSKWISNNYGGAPEEKHQWLGRGYFATTTGKSAAEEVAAYLERQGEHHGYGSVPQSPVYIRTYDRHDANDRLLATDHAVTRLQYHLVLATEWRRGVFSKESAAMVAERWRAMQTEIKAVIRKVSILPDHVHLAVDLHPTVLPASVAVALMNAAQALMIEKFDMALIRARVNRLWQASAYVGSFGDLRSAAIASYIKRWESDEA